MSFFFSVLAFDERRDGLRVASLCGLCPASRSSDRRPSPGRPCRARTHAAASFGVAFDAASASFRSAEETLRSWRQLLPPPAALRMSCRPTEFAGADAEQHEGGREDDREREEDPLAAALQALGEELLLLRSSGFARARAALAPSSSVPRSTPGYPWCASARLMASRPLENVTWCAATPRDSLRLAQDFASGPGYCRVEIVFLDLACAPRCARGRSRTRRGRAAAGTP